MYDRLDREVSMAVDPAVGAGRISRMDRKRFGAPAGSYTKQADYAYDPNGNRSADERGTHEYNSRDQLVAWSKPDGGPRTTYALNGSGSITSQTSDGMTTRFTYAADSERLRFSQTDGFTTTEYDPGGLGEIVGYRTAGEPYCQGMSQPLTLTAVFTPDDDGWTMAQLAEWPAVVTCGRTVDEARTMLLDAAQEMLASYRDEGRPPPIGTGHVEPLTIDTAA